MSRHRGERDGRRDDDVDARVGRIAARVRAGGLRVAKLEAKRVRLLAEVAAEARDATKTRPAPAGTSFRFAHVPSSEERELVWRSAAAEIATRTHRSDHVVLREIIDADTAATAYPDAVVGLGRGDFTTEHLWALVREGRRITGSGHTTERLARYERGAITICTEQTIGRARPLLKQLVNTILEADAEERHRAAREGRALWIEDLIDGMAELTLRAPSVLVHGMFNRITSMANTLIDADPCAGESDDGAACATLATDRDGSAGGNEGAPRMIARTLGQRRADVMTALVLTGAPDTEDQDTAIPEGYGAIRAHVSVTVEVTSLLGGGSVPAYLPNGDMAPLDITRQLAGDVPGWDRIMRGRDGAIIAVDRYRPSAAQRRFLRAADRHCRFPGCHQPIRSSHGRTADADHTEDYALGGQTDIANLAHLCAWHHTLKHGTGWTVRQRPGGVLEWTSPADATYRDIPHGVMFAEALTAASPPG